MKKTIKELNRFMDNNKIAQMEILFEKVCDILSKDFGYRVEFRPCLCDCFSYNPNMKVLAKLFDKEITRIENK